MVWPTVKSRTATERNRTARNGQPLWVDWQVWDVASGVALEPSGGQAADWCTASCPFHDRHRLALARLDVAPSAAPAAAPAAVVVVVVFDLLRNEPVRRLRHRLDAAVTSQHVGHVTVTADDRYRRGSVRE